MSEFEWVENRSRPAIPDWISESDAESARREIQSWPSYSQTPLHSLKDVADDLGLSSLSFKDEGSRFGLGSFKALGGAYAVYRVLAEHVEKATGVRPSSEELRQGRYREHIASRTVTCATDGNHGRSVAWGAQLFGCQCVIYLHEGVSLGREKAIAAYGARIVRTEGHYDDSLRAALDDAQREGWDVIADTSTSEEIGVSRLVVHGYTVLVDEALEQWREGGMSDPPTHVVLQGGVGSFAAGVCARLHHLLGSPGPRIAIVEPREADCLFQSARAGRPTTAKGTLDTVMACLSCAQVSIDAWPTVFAHAEVFAILTDDAAIDTMRLLARRSPPLITGESGVAGLAGIIEIAKNPKARQAFGLSSTSRVLVVGTEGATDPEIHARLTKEG